MRNVGFVCTEITFLKYFYPLAYEFSKQGWKCNFYASNSSKKWSRPTRPEFSDDLDNMCYYASPWIYDSQEKLEQFSNNNKDDIVFFVEGAAISTNFKAIKISLTYMTDFYGLSKSYEDTVDYTVTPSSWFTRYIGLKNELLFGSPKYDCVPLFDKQKICEKYQVENRERTCLILAPNFRDFKQDYFTRIIELLKIHNYQCIVKFRQKDSYSTLVDSNVKCVTNESYLIPSTLELMYVSDLVVLFDSSAIKESIIMNKPTVNFRIKPWKDSNDPLPVLTKKSLGPLFDAGHIKELVGWEHVDHDIMLAVGQACSYDSDYREILAQICFAETYNNIGNISKGIVKQCESML